MWIVMKWKMCNQKINVIKWECRKWICKGICKGSNDKYCEKRYGKYETNIGTNFGYCKNSGGEEREAIIQLLQKQE